MSESSSRSRAPVPGAIRARRQSRLLELTYADGTVWQLPYEYLRVFSPSAEVQGHGPGQAILQTGKRDVTLTDLQPAGNYALQLTFSDGHHTGLYTWDYLWELGENQEDYWASYLEQLTHAGASRG